MTQELPVMIDDERTIVIYGVRYSMAIFQHLGLGPVGSIIKIVGRDGDSVALQKLDDPCWCPYCGGPHDIATPKRDV